METTDLPTLETRIATLEASYRPSKTRVVGIYLADMAGPVKMVGIPIKFSLTSGAVGSASPGIGEYTSEILQCLGYTPTEQARLQDAKVI